MCCEEDTAVRKHQKILVKPFVRRVFFTMVNHPRYGWIRVGKAYASKKYAQELVPFVRSYWRGLRTKVVSCSLRFVDGKLTAESAKKLDVKFNMSPPDGLEITSGERTAIELPKRELRRGSQSHQRLGYPVIIERTI